MKVGLNTPLSCYKQDPFPSQVCVVGGSQTHWWADQVLHECKVNNIRKLTVYPEGKKSFSLYGRIWDQTAAQPLAST